MEVDSVQKKTDPDRIVRRKKPGPGQAPDLQLVGQNIEAPRPALVEDHLPRLVLGTKVRLADRLLQLEIAQIDGREGDSDANEDREYREARGDSPDWRVDGIGTLAGAAHGRGSESFEAAAQSSSHISPLSVHSAVSNPEICSSSSFKVPCP